MKVLKNNYLKDNCNERIRTIEPYPRNLICEECGSELEYEESDLKMGFLGCMHLECPLCGCSNMLDDNENNIDITANNIEFPDHFWHTSKATGAVDRCNTEEIKKEIRRAIEHFRKNKDEFVWFSSSGNLYVNVYRLDGEEIYDVVISNDFYNTSIPFEKEDY